MKNLRTLILLTAGLSLFGCATLSPPGREEIAGVPVVTFGTPVPSGKAVILRFPAGVPLPVVASVDGTLFRQTARETLQVSLQRDVYVYRQWVSFDGKNWLPKDRAIDGRFQIKLPGTEDGTNAGSMAATFNLK